MESDTPLDTAESKSETLETSEPEAATTSAIPDGKAEEISTNTSQEEDSGGTIPKTSIEKSPINPESTETKQEKEKVDFKVIYNKKKYDINFELDASIEDLKKHVETLTGVPPSMQKMMFKGLAKDQQTLRDLKVTKGSKFMVVGSTINDLLTISSVDPKQVQKEEAAAQASKESLSSQKIHKKVLEKYGKPEDSLVGVKHLKEPLPAIPLSGMYNKAGGKVRLTFKMELDQVWIGTKERTEKIPMSSIKNVISEPLDGHEEYHIMGIQLGPTEASRYWVYWVPSQYIDAIKEAILGKWQFF